MQLAERTYALQNLDLALENIDCRGDLPLQARRSLALYECVRVVALGERDDAHGEALTQQLVPGPERRGKTATIVVVQQNRVLGVLADERYLGVGERRSHRC